MTDTTREQDDAVGRIALAHGTLVQVTSDGRDDSDAVIALVYGRGAYLDSDADPPEVRGGDVIARYLCGPNGTAYPMPEGA
jgi:hypothetical protein